MTTSDSAPNPEADGSGGDLRVGDAERIEAVQALSRHFADGRLDQAEFDERSTAVYAARTRSDLAPLFFDLPASEFGDPALAAAADGAERSRRVPATVAGSEVAASETPDDAVASRWRGTIVAVTPLVALVAFFVLGNTVGYHLAWLVWLVVPIVTLLVKGPDNDDDEDDGDASSRRRLRRN